MITLGTHWELCWQIIDNSSILCLFAVNSDHWMLINYIYISISFSIRYLLGLICDTETEKAFVGVSWLGFEMTTIFKNLEASPWLTSICLHHQLRSNHVPDTETCPSTCLHLPVYRLNMCINIYVCMVVPSLSLHKFTFLECTTRRHLQLYLSHLTRHLSYHTLCTHLYNICPQLDIVFAVHSVPWY